MTGIKRIDDEWSVTENLTFKDDGPVKKGAKTRRFSVFSRTNRSLLAYIKWFPHWRKYCLFTLDSVVLDSKCILQIAEFMNEATANHKVKLPGLRKMRERQLAVRQKRIEKLTGKQGYAIIGLELKEVERQVEPVPESEKPVVEGSDAPVVQGDNYDS